MNPIQITGYETEVLDELIKDQMVITFKELDDVLIDKDIPLDISNLIYDFYRPVVCLRCQQCCKVCRYYCHYECLRDDRNICAKYELGAKHRKYNLFPIKEETEEKV